MNKLKVIIGSIFLTFQIYADDYVGVQVDPKGLVTNILPFYRSPTLTDWKGSYNAETSKEPEII
ncbi:MAG: hypothetical protein C5B43_01680 [Verrucomicrobia bacterium]|nr:MAG: hypothetical protein C5B43_01680 [Verrucomicrobiota bacterium]